MTMHKGDTIVVVAGPTASGKSALAMDVAEEFGGVVINADSMQVYAELRLITARPSEADEARVPHALYGVRPAAEGCSVAEWLEMARGAVAEARADGRLPIIAGGTGLYLKALMEGLVAVPEVPDAVRDAAETRFQAIGGLAFRDELAALDPEAAVRLEAGDRQRLVRAYAVAKATGRALSDWQKEEAGVPPVAGRYARIKVLPEREVLYATCDARFEAMMAEGALEEVRAFDALGLSDALPLCKAVGVPELRAHLYDEMALEEAVERAKRATRQYAKRQLTWLRHQLDADHVIDAQYSESLREKTFSFIRRFLLTPPS